jgi:hypothetical protein
MNGYRLLLVSAVGGRDGMALELSLDTGEQVAEVFQDEDTRTRSVTFFTGEPVPLEAVQWLLSEAANRL